jgi:hypothetical protein
LSITKSLVDNLETHLDLCMAISNALNDPNLHLTELDDTSTINAFRYANLIRHHFVRLPLLNYTNYPGSFTTRLVKNIVKVDPRKLKLSPRYVNFDECLMLANSGDVKLDGASSFRWACDIYKAINRIELEGMEWDFTQANGEASDGKL